jgi:hypothetical protein
LNSPGRKRLRRIGDLWHDANTSGQM